MLSARPASQSADRGAQHDEADSDQPAMLMPSSVQVTSAQLPVPIVIALRMSAQRERIDHVSHVGAARRDLVGGQTLQPQLADRKAGADDAAQQSAAMG